MHTLYAKERIVQIFLGIEMTMSIHTGVNLGEAASASQKVEDYIKQSVYTGKLRPRERIIEDDLARQLGVSRGTVRESLLRLERDGLTVTTSRRGTYIRDLSHEETKVVFKMRGKLEGLSVRYMREAMAPETEAVLKKALRKMQKAATANDDELFHYADMEIHHTIWKLSGQPLLIRTLNSVMNPFIFIIARSATFPIPLVEKFENHKRYVDMISQKKKKKSGPWIGSRLRWNDISKNCIRISFSWPSL